MPHTTAPRCAYSTPNPDTDIAEVYFAYAEVLPIATDPEKCWVVKEQHGWFDDVAKKLRFDTTTLSPEATHCVDIQEAFCLVDQQVLVRVQQGFKYLFEWYPYGAPWSKRYEILPDGTKRAMP